MRHLRKHDDHDYWKPCKPGTILSVSDSNFQRERRRWLIQATMGGTVVAAGLFSVIFTVSHRNRSGLANQTAGDGTTLETVPAATVALRLACSDIKEQLDDYVVAYCLETDLRDEHQAGLIEDFAKHLSYCRKCERLVAAALRNV